MEGVGGSVGGGMDTCVDVSLRTPPSRLALDHVSVYAPVNALAQPTRRSPGQAPVQAPASVPAHDISHRFCLEVTFQNNFLEGNFLNRYAWKNAWKKSSKKIVWKESSQTETKSSKPFMMKRIFQTGFF